MNIDEQLRQAARQLSAGLETIPIPDLPKQPRHRGARAAMAAVSVVAVVGAIVWVRGGDGTSSTVSSTPDPAVTASDRAETEEADVEEAAEEEFAPVPEPAGPEVIISQGSVDGETWQLVGFVRTDGDLCMRLMGGLDCGPIPGEAALLSSPSMSRRDVPGPRFSCAYGGLGRDDLSVLLTFTDGSVVRPPIYSGGELPADFYAHCWVGDSDLATVDVLDADGTTVLSSGTGVTGPAALETPTAGFTLRYSQRAGFYTEGSATEFDLQRTSVSVVTGAVLSPTEGQSLARIRPEPGLYMLRSWQRPCPASCGSTLEPPVDVCATEFTAPDQTAIDAVVVVRPFQGCVFDLSGVEAATVEVRDVAAGWPADAA